MNERSGRLANKVVLVTGGSRGIGAAIARRLAEDGAAAVAITYVSSPDKAQEMVREIEAAGAKGLAIRADAANPEATRAAVAETVAAFGGLDILVNNAGVLMRGLVTEFSVEDFDRIVAVNVRAAFVATQAAVAHMKEGGRVVNIGSMTADVSVYPGTAFYSMSKAAIAAMTRGFAIDLAPRGITVNNLQPGPTLTDINAEHADWLKTKVPLQRLGTPEEIAAFVSFLAGPESGFVTGASLTIDGGLTA